MYTYICIIHCHVNQKYGVECLRQENRGQKNSPIIMDFLCASKANFCETLPCADPESFARGGSTLKCVLVSNSTISGSSSVRHWRADDDLVACHFRGSGPVLLRNPIFCDISGVPTPCLPLCGSAHVGKTFEGHVGYVIW